MTNNRATLPAGWHWEKLGDVCAHKINTHDPSDESENEFVYIDITSIDTTTKTIARPKILLGKNAPSRARQVIQIGDVIVSTTRPNLNAVAKILPEYNKQICSTGFCVLRPKSDELDSDFLYHFVQTRSFVQNLSDLVKGALYPAVTDKDVRGQSIPLPPLDEQQRIAVRLNEQMAAVESARRAAESQLRAARNLPAAYLREVFDDTRLKKWHWDKLGEHVTKIGSGVTPIGGQASYLSSGIPLIRSQNVHMNRFFYDGLAFISREQDAEMANSRVLLNDVLLNITGASIGRICVVPQEVCPANVNQHVSIIRCGSEIIPEFLSLYISRPDFQKTILAMQAGATRQALTKALIENFNIPLPDIQEQKSIVNVLLNKMKENGILVSKLESQLAEINQLPAALLRQAFSGGLS